MDTPYSELAKGTLLVASPDIGSELFARSVVMICEHSSSGSFGLILNKTLPMEIPEDISGLDAMSNPRVAIVAGGPIQPSQMLLLHASQESQDQTVKLCDGVYLGGDLNFLQQTANNEEGPDMRMVFGYTGWGPGQLEKEFLHGLWYLYPSRKDLAFFTPADRLWSTILKEMGGKYASISTMPPDLSIN